MRYQIGDFTLDASLRELFRGSEEVGLAPKEFAVLLCLADAGGRAVAREAMMQAAWPDMVVGDTSLAKCISSLRRLLGSTAIAVVPKYGYRLTLPVRWIEEDRTQREPDVVATETATGLAGWMPRLVQSGPRWAVAGAMVLSAAVLLGGGRLGTVGAATLEGHAPTWTDPQTRLEWARTDNGRDVTRVQAIAYCHALDLNGKNDWRLPTIEELQTLHDPAVAIAGVWGGNRKVYWHVKGGIHVTGGETASDVTLPTDQTPAGEEQSYDYSYERRNYDPDGFYSDHRALCVR